MKLIRQTAEGMDVSQVELARAAGIAPSCLCDILRGYKVPLGDTCSRLMYSLGMTPEDIRVAIQERQQAAGWSAAELARRSGLGHGRLNRYLCGERDMSITLLEPVMDALGVEVAGRI